MSPLQALTRPTASGRADDDAAALALAGDVFASGIAPEMRRETLALVLLAQRDAILPSARVVDGAATKLHGAFEMHFLCIST